MYVSLDLSTSVCIIPPGDLEIREQDMWICLHRVERFETAGQTVSVSAVSVNVQWPSRVVRPRRAAESLENGEEFCSYPETTSTEANCIHILATVVYACGASDYVIRWTDPPQVYVGVH